MEYRVTIKSNPRLLILFAIIGLIPIGAVLVLLFWSPIAGVIILGIGGYIDYHLIKFARLQLKSHVKTDEDGIHGLSGISEAVDISWEDVSHAGVCSESGPRKAAFVYDEKEDQLITVPSDYEDFNSFVAELDERFDLLRFHMAANETPADKLREYFEETEAQESAEEIDED